MLQSTLMGVAAAEPLAGLSPVTASVTVLLNSAAGAAARATGGQHPALDEVREAFSAAGLRASVAVASAETLAGLARSAVARGVPLIVAGGGDGTIGTIASVLVDSKATLGILPLGTLNHFAKDLGIPLDVPGAVRVITAGRTSQVDVGAVNGRVFVNNSSLGLYPSLVYHREKRQEQGRRKWVAFAIAVARVWQHYRRVRVVVHSHQGSRTIRTPFVFVGNNEYHLEGVRIGARKRLHGGRLHVATAPGMTRAELLRVVGRALLRRRWGEDQLDSLLTREVTIAAWRRRLPVALDGEVRLLRTPLRYSVRPGALNVCVPGAPGVDG